uniref:Tungstate transport system permease protein n=1 Tax=Candidatus Kentrum sp. LFY TaxID=2126342 RepID=A0A450WCN6_9GAMM|nr:MAG: tungstate transport system permease protein [Candidatus Kentron sp. LFY]VFK01595.1 MAG: tungstate transport system permease protein [Candidatus Kentron sp. LFY]VFK14721.1 MAG: tungstate transport system permease protein [Candidatus Kentron sp. LFY]
MAIMNDFHAALHEAIAMMITMDSDLGEIIATSMGVSLTAVLLASLIGLPLGAIVALSNFPGRKAMVVSLNALMGLPPVVVGLVVYLSLSRMGPLGTLGLLFTPTAMIIAQWVLVTPIIAALTRQIVADLWEEYGEQLRSLGTNQRTAVSTLLWEGRFSLLTAILAGFGRAIAEVGAVMIVGGNIDHVTRVMTTTISLETSKGNLPLALGLGIVLITISLVVNAGVFMVRDKA